MKWILLAAIASLPTLQAQTLGAFETFTVQETAEGWGLYDYSTDEAFIASWNLSNSDDPEIYGIFTQDSGISLFADEMSSSGYFVGNYTDAGIDTVVCDVFVEDLSSFGDLEFYLLAGGTFYYSDFYDIDQEGWSGLTSSLLKDQWYIYDDSDAEFVPVNLTPLILTDIIEIGINFYPNSVEADGKAVALDNFTLLPNLDPPTVSITSTSDSAELDFIGIEGLEYTIQTSPSLTENTWTTVGSPFEITGTSQTTLPIANRSFFRVLSRPFYIEAP